MAGVKLVSLTETPKSVILSTGSSDLNPGDSSRGRPGLGLADVTSTGEAILSFPFNSKHLRILFELYLETIL
jgi:hypothetical protein